MMRVPPMRRGYSDFAYGNLWIRLRDAAARGIVSARLDPPGGGEGARVFAAYEGRDGEREITADCHAFEIQLTDAVPA